MLNLLCPGYQMGFQLLQLACSHNCNVTLGLSSICTQQGIARILGTVPQSTTKAAEQPDADEEAQRQGEIRKIWSFDCQLIDSLDLIHHRSPQHQSIPQLDLTTWWPGLWAKRIYPIRKDGNLLLCSSVVLGSCGPAIQEFATESWDIYIYNYLYLYNKKKSQTNYNKWQMNYHRKTNKDIIAWCSRSYIIRDDPWVFKTYRGCYKHTIMWCLKVQCCWATWWWTPILPS